MHVQRLRARRDVQVVGEVGRQRLVQRRVGAQHGQDLVHLRPEPLGRDLADHERTEVEVLEAHHAPLAVARGMGDGELRVAERVVGVGDGRDGAADPDAHVRPGLEERPERVDDSSSPPCTRAAIAAVRAARGRDPCLLQHGDDLPHRAEVERRACGARRARRHDRAPGRRSRRRTPPPGRPAAAGRAGRRLEGLRQQRGLDRLLLVARDVAQPSHRRQQRRRGLRRRLGELRRSRGAAWPAPATAPRPPRRWPRARRPRASRPRRTRTFPAAPGAPAAAPPRADARRPPPARRRRRGPSRPRRGTGRADRRSRAPGRGCAARRRDSAGARSGGGRPARRRPSARSRRTGRSRGRASRTER